MGTKNKLKMRKWDLKRKRLKYHLKKKNINNVPRLIVIRSNNNIFTQLVDDVNSKTIFPNHDNYFENARNKINKYLNNNDYVLTNRPYKDLFPNNKLIALFGYRTFYGGVNKEAADKVFIFNNQDYYEGIGKNSIIYFKGFYQILRCEKIIRNYQNLPFSTPYKTCRKRRILKPLKNTYKTCRLLSLFVKCLQK